MILWGYVIDFSVFQLQKSLKIVSNVVFVKLKVNFSQAINALLTGWCFYTGRHKALGPRNALPSVGHYVGPWALYLPAQKHQPVSKAILLPDCMFIRKMLWSDWLDSGTWTIYTFPYRRSGPSIWLSIEVKTRRAFGKMAEKLSTEVVKC